MPFLSLLSCSRQTVLAVMVGTLPHALTQVAEAQVMFAPNLHPRQLEHVQSSRVDEEVVRLLTGLALIESDLQLGLLLHKDRSGGQSGAHFIRARTVTLPAIKDGLLAAGIADLDPRLAALEAGGGDQALMRAYTDAVGALMHARRGLDPTPDDLLRSILDQTRLVAGKINSDGVTNLAEYQDAWALLVVTRNQVDLLVRHEDEVAAGAARQIAQALDDIILSMPDPNSAGPVDFDPAPVLSAIGILEGLTGSA